MKYMLDTEVTRHDDFLSMPHSVQCLYFHLQAETDHDGFIDNAFSTCRTVGCSEADLATLIERRFLLLFPSRVIVVKHHRINNNKMKSDRYRPTKYQREFSTIETRAEDGVYTEKDKKAALTCTGSGSVPVRKQTGSPNIKININNELSSPLAQSARRSKGGLWKTLFGTTTTGREESR